MDWNGKHYWLIGASSGLGAALATKLAIAGATLTLSARSEDKLKELNHTLTGSHNVVACDVSDTQNVKKAFLETIKDKALDGIIFCAGVYAPMKATNWDSEAAIQISDVNFTGAMRIVGQYLPYMLETGHGHLALTGSLSSLKGIPGGGAYAASKGGLKHLAEGLRADLARDDFKIQLINPGFIRTRLTDKNDFNMPFIMEPEDAANRMKKALESSRFQTNFPKRFAAIFEALGILPNRFYFPLARKLLTTK